MMNENKMPSLESLAMLPHELICCWAKLSRWMCESLPPNSNPELKALFCAWAQLLEVLCRILTPGTRG